MANFFEDNKDLQFYVDKGLDWKALAGITELDYLAPDGFSNTEEAVEFYRSILDLVGKFTATEIAPHAARIDLERPTLEDGVVKLPQLFQDNFDKMRDLDLHGMCLPRELGGMNCPLIMFMLVTEILSRADVSVAAHFGFHGGIAMALLLYSAMEGTTDFDAEKLEYRSTRFSVAIEEIIAGEAWGSMDITEPGAGSDMAMLRTKGELDDDGNWRVTGEKMFITSGHGKYHFVIARTEKQTEGDDAFTGLTGLSMFLVLAYEIDGEGNRVNHVTFTKLEEKLGLHGSATVAVHFDETPAYLVGERGEGFKLMLQLMNNARIGVGFECLGICDAAWRMASEYASERQSMGKTIDRHEMIADYLDEMETDVQGLRALAVQSAFHEEMGQKLGLQLQFRPPGERKAHDQAERSMKSHQAASRRYTPLLKYLGGEKAVEISRRAIQIHGGYGYSMEFGAEKLLRDAVVLPIYEGTSQIQALMVMKDSLMGILKDPKRFYARFARAWWAAWTAPSKQGRRVARLQALSYRTLQFLVTRLAVKKLSGLRGRPIAEWVSTFKNWDPKKDFALAMLHAERLTRIMADVAVCEILLEQTTKHPERGELLDRYLERALPRCKYLFAAITGSGARLLSRLADAGAD